MRKALSRALDRFGADVEAVHAIRQALQILRLMTFAAAELEQRADAAELALDDPVGRLEARDLARRIHVPRIFDRIGEIETLEIVVRADAAQRVLHPRTAFDLLQERSCLAQHADYSLQLLGGDHTADGDGRSAATFSGRSRELYQSLTRPQRNATHDGPHIPSAVPSR